MQQQRSVRDQLLKEIEDTRRIDDQRVYREKLGEQGAKRKDRRRKLREQTNCQKYVAKIERKRVEQAAPLAIGTSADHEVNNGPSGDIIPAASQPKLLTWERAAVSHRGGHPQWVSRPVWTNQRQSSSSGHDKSQVLLSQCQRIFDTLQLTNERRQQLRRSLVDSGGTSASLKRVAAGRPETAP